MNSKDHYGRRKSDKILNFINILKKLSTYIINRIIGIDFLYYIFCIY